MKLHFERWGGGSQPVILLHGFTGDHSAWTHLRKSWGHRFDVIAVDLPGHGASPLPKNAGARGFVETVRAVTELIDAEANGKAAVVGYSLGARLALAVALATPERVTRLVMESGSPGLKRRKARMARRRDDESWAGMIESEGIEAFVAKWEALPLFSSLRQMPKASQADLRARRLSAKPEGLASALRTLGTGIQPNLWPLLHSLRVPTLLVTGALDEKFTRIAHEMAGELPNAWFHAVPNAGHAPHLETPDAYAAEVVTFLQTPWFDGPELEPLLETETRLHT